MSNNNNNAALAAHRLALVAADRCIADFSSLPADVRALPAYRAALDHHIAAAVDARNAYLASI